MSDPLEAFRAQFAKRCAEALETLSNAGAAADEVRRTIHHLAGSAAMFGFDQIGHLAGRLDDQAQDGQPYEPADLAALKAALKASLA